MSNMNWETVIGLEVHTQLLTQSKLFSGSATAYGADVNTQAGVIDLAMPGVLPVLNQEAVTMAIKLGLAIHGHIARRSIFARKNYFYPDLPKGYQITQHELPIISDGYLDIALNDKSTKRIHITRAHLEEDSGKSLHEAIPGMTGIDLNRAGIALIEIVSAPDLRSAEEAVAYLKALHTLVRYLGISDGNMQEGSFRCDVNVSVKPKGSDQLGTRTETKNLNSFRFVEHAIQSEVARQIKILEAGGKIIQETLAFDSVKNETKPLREKEESHDYRYFPEPDLLPLVITEETIESIQKTLPELPTEKLNRFTTQYHLSAYDAHFLTADRDTANYFESIIRAETIDPKLAVNWMMGELSAALNNENLSIIQSAISAEHLAQLLKRIQDNTISGAIAKTVFEAMWHQEGTADAIIEKKGLKQITDTGEIETMIDEIIAANPQELAGYRSGKTKLLGFFVGLVMQRSKGKANPQQVNVLLLKKLAG
ncbi:MAG TPA: Asp-tRNA(Asn)/Glu-tRNA(Gln) amidotransferase GatCAB subunit B [Coxiellaceae bacterium]|nr:Asp-tRNA(Asn)/Glu-tRNA(Gln) amidotransferase GatCAB subunit B [Coxiellaceae bacterium]